MTTEHKMTDAQRMAIEDQAPISAADEQLKSQISADAYHIVRCAREDAREASGRIVKHMWIIFVLLPVVFYVVYEMATH